MDAVIITENDRIRGRLAPCACGNADLIVWGPAEEIYDIEKIECPDCGNIVYGLIEESIEDWNQGRYDD